MITKLFLEACDCGSSLKKTVESNKSNIDKVKEVEKPWDLYESEEVELDETINGATAGDFATLEPMNIKYKKKNGK
jgi:hypothetical protein